MNLLGYRAFATELLKIATEVRDPDIRAMIAEAKGKEYLNGGALRANSEVETNFKPKLAANFMAFTPVGTYNILGKRRPEAQPSSAYERASGTAGAALKGGMTGAGAGTLIHTLRHGHDLRMAPKPLAKWVGAGTGIALADRALRRHATKRNLEQAVKTANLDPQTFTPARQLHANQSRGTFENKLHRGVVKSTPGVVGNAFRLPQGV